MHDTGRKDETPPQYRFRMHVTDRRFALFALNATAELGSALAAALKHPLAPHEEREFEDGEHKTRPLEAVNPASSRVSAAKRFDTAKTHCGSRALQRRGRQPGRPPRRI